MYRQLPYTYMFLVVLLCIGTHINASPCPAGRNCGIKTSKERLERNTVDNMDKVTRKIVQNEVIKTDLAVQNKAKLRLPETVEIRSNYSSKTYPRYSFNFNPIPTNKSPEKKASKRIHRSQSRPTFSVRTGGTSPLFRANSQSRRFRQKFSPVSRQSRSGIINDKRVFNRKSPAPEKENADLGIALGIATSGINTQFSDKQEKRVNSISRMQSNRRDTLNITTFDRQSGVKNGKASLSNLHGIEVSLGDGQIHLNSHAILSNVGKDVGIKVKKKSHFTKMSPVNLASNIEPVVHGSPTFSEITITNETVYEAPIALGLVQPSINDAEIITRRKDPVTKSTRNTIDKSLYAAEITSPAPSMDLYPTSESTTNQAPIALGLVQPLSQEARIHTRPTDKITTTSSSVQILRTTATWDTPPPVKPASKPKNKHTASEQNTSRMKSDIHFRPTEYEAPVALGLVQPAERKSTSQTESSIKFSVTKYEAPIALGLVQPSERESTSQAESSVTSTVTEYEAPLALGLVQPTERKSTSQTESSIKSSVTEYETPIALGLVQSSGQSKSIPSQMETSTTAKPKPKLSVSELGSRINITEKPSLVTSMSSVTPTNDAVRFVGLEHLQREKNDLKKIVDSPRIPPTVFPSLNTINAKDKTVLVSASKPTIFQTPTFLGLVQPQSKTTGFKSKAISDIASSAEPLPTTPVVTISGVTHPYLSQTTKLPTYEAPGFHNLQSILKEQHKGIIPPRDDHIKESAKAATYIKTPPPFTSRLSSSDISANDSPIALGLVQSEPNPSELKAVQLVNNKTPPVLLVIDKSKSQKALQPSLRSQSTLDINKVLRYQEAIESETKPTDSAAAYVLSKSPKQQMENRNESITMKTMPPPPVIPFPGSENEVIEAPTYSRLVQSDSQLPYGTAKTVVATEIPTTLTETRIGAKRSEDNQTIKSVSHSNYSEQLHGSAQNEMNLAHSESKPLVRNTQHEILITEPPVPTMESPTKLVYENILVNESSSNTDTLKRAITGKSTNIHETKALNLHDTKAKSLITDMSEVTNTGQNTKNAENALTERQKATKVSTIHNNEIMNIDSEMSVIEHKSVVISKIPSSKIKHLRDVTYNIGGLTIRPKIVKTVAEENLTIPVDLTIPDDRPEIILVAVIPNKLRNAHYSVAMNEKTRPDVTLGDIVNMQTSTLSSTTVQTKSDANIGANSVFTSSTSNNVDTSKLITSNSNSLTGVVSTDSLHSSPTQRNIKRPNRLVSVPASTKKVEFRLPITTTPNTLSVAGVIDVKNASMFQTPDVEFKELLSNTSLATKNIVSTNISKNVSEGFHSTSPVSGSVSHINGEKLRETKLEIISNLSKIIGKSSDINIQSTMLEQVQTTMAPVVSGSQLMGEIEMEGEDVIDAAHMMAFGNTYPERTSTSSPIDGLFSAVMNMEYNASKVLSSNAHLTDSKILEGISYNIGGQTVRPNILRTVSKENLTIPIDLILTGDRPEVVLLALITDPVTSKKTYSITLNSNDTMPNYNGEHQSTVLPTAEVLTPTIHTNVTSPDSLHTDVTSPEQVNVTDNYTSDVQNVMSLLTEVQISVTDNVTENYTGNVVNAASSTVLDMQPLVNGNVTLPVSVRTGSNVILPQNNLVASIQNIPNPNETPKFTIGKTIDATTNTDNSFNVPQPSSNTETSSHSFLTAVVGSELNAMLPNNNIVISNLSTEASMPTKELENLTPVLAETQNTLSISPTQPGQSNLENAHITVLTADTTRKSDPTLLNISELKSDHENTNERPSFSSTKKDRMLPPQPSIKLSSSIDETSHLTLWSAKNPVLKDETLIILPLEEQKQKSVRTINMTIVEDKNTKATDTKGGRSVTLTSKDQTTARTYMPFETSTSGEFKTNDGFSVNTYTSKAIPPVQYFTSKQSISPLTTDTYFLGKSSSTNPPKHTTSVNFSAAEKADNEITASSKVKKEAATVRVGNLVAENIQRGKENASPISMENTKDSLTKAALEVLCKRYTSSHVDYVSYAPYPLDCSKMIQCIDTGVTTEPVIRHCPMGLFWDQSLLMCRKPKDVPCVKDKCLTGVQNYTGHWGCRSFYKCSDAVSMPKCCPVGYRFTERPDGAGDCVEDATCTESCNTLRSTIRKIKKDPSGCHTLPDEKNKDMYWDITHGTLQMRACPDGTVYSKSRCTCAVHAFHASNGRHHAGCRPEFELDFHSGRIRDISHGGLSFDHRHISPVDGYGIFRGSSRVYIWGFINKDLGDIFAIKLRIKPNKGGCMEAPESIISNCGPDGEPSVDITCYKRQIKFTTRTHGYPKAVIIAINFTEDRWLDLTYTYNNNRATGQVDDRLYHKVMGGRIEQRNNPMVIGKCPKISGFRGKVDNIAIYTTCVPGKYV